MEYHKSSELDLAVTGLVLLLARAEDLKENRMDSGLAEAFYLPAGTAVELFAGTFHFAPCRVEDGGFKSVIILPAGTNTPLRAGFKPVTPEDSLLWMKNKWLIAHPDSIPAKKGAFAGITGENREIAY